MYGQKSTRGKGWDGPFLDNASYLINTNFSFFHRFHPGQLRHRGPQQQPEASVRRPAGLYRPGAGNPTEPRYQRQFDPCGHEWRLNRPSPCFLPDPAVWWLLSAFIPRSLSAGSARNRNVEPVFTNPKLTLTHAKKVDYHFPTGVENSTLDST